MVALPLRSRVGLPSFQAGPRREVRTLFAVGVLRSADSCARLRVCAPEICRCWCFLRRSCLGEGSEPYRLKLFLPAGSGRSSRDQLPPAASGPTVGISGGGISGDDSASTAVCRHAQQLTSLKFNTKGSLATTRRTPCTRTAPRQRARQIPPPRPALIRLICGTRVHARACMVHGLLY